MSGRKSRITRASLRGRYVRERGRIKYPRHERFTRDLVDAPTLIRRQEFSSRKISGREASHFIAHGEPENVPLPKVDVNLADFLASENAVGIFIASAESTVEGRRSDDKLVSAFARRELLRYEKYKRARSRKRRDKSRGSPKVNSTLDPRLRATRNCAGETTYRLI